MPPNLQDTLVERNLGIAQGFPEIELGPDEAILDETFLKVFPGFKLGDQVQFTLDALRFLPPETAMKIVEIVRNF